MSWRATPARKTGNGAHRLLRRAVPHARFRERDSRTFGQRAQLDGVDEVGPGRVDHDAPAGLHGRDGGGRAAGGVDTDEDPQLDVGAGLEGDAGHALHGAEPGGDLPLDRLVAPGRRPVPPVGQGDDGGARQAQVAGAGVEDPQPVIPVRSTSLRS